MLESSIKAVRKCGACHLDLVRKIARKNQKILQVQEGKKMSTLFSNWHGKMAESISF